MLKDDVTILINSCDSYSDCWEPFFTLWYKYFPDHSVRIILNTESKTFSYDGLIIDCFQKYKSNERPSFGNQLNEHLKEVNTPFVIPLLEDFFLQSEVEIERILQVLDWMKKDENIATFYFTNSVNPYDVPSKKYLGFSEKPKICQYKVNTMGSLWRTDKLKLYSLPNTSPWEWEYYGSIKSFEKDDKFFVVDKDEKPIFDYIRPAPLKDGTIIRTLWGVVQGKWVVESVDKLFKENNITVDFSQRGVLDINNIPQVQLTNKPTVPLEKIVGKNIAKDIKKFEVTNRLKSFLHIPHITDYADYKAYKANK